VQYQDAAGNASESYTGTIVVDTTAPTGSITINSGAPYTSSTSVTLELSAQDAGSGVFQMRISNDGTNWSDWEPYATSKAWTLTSGDGTKTVNVQYQDNAGNVSGSYTATIILLQTLTISGAVTSRGNGLANVVMSGLPGNPVTGADGAYSATVDYGFTGTVTPTLAGYSFMPASKAYTSVQSNQTQDYAATLQTLTISGMVTSGGSGLTNVVMSGLPNNPVTDNNGNYSAAVTYDWSGTVTPILAGYTFNLASKTYMNVHSNQTQDYTATDIAAPTGSVVINGGAKYTNTASVALTLSASDAGSGVSQVRFSNDGNSWSGWESYSTSKSWNLIPGEGTRTVYVQYKDNAGNISSSYYDAIILITLNNITDFDGDGKTDVAVYDVANGWWFIHNSNDGSYVFDAIGVGGGSQWKPVPEDYDGDGKADVAVYDAQNGWWLFHYSSGGYFYDHIGAGGTGYGAVPGDYDGDGVTDIAVYDETNGYWYVKYSNGGYGFDSLGGPGREPVNLPYLFGAVF
jgi:hypothetical protein